MTVTGLDSTSHPPVRSFLLILQKIAVTVAFLGLLILCALAVFGAWSITVKAARHGSIEWSYPYSAYLVDYSAGFVRRGAIGAVIGHLAQGGPRLLLTSLLLFVNYVVLMICVFALILLNAKRKLEAALLVLLLPSGIVMAGVMGGFFVWKEALFLGALAAFGCGYNLIVRLPSGSFQRILGRILIAALLAFSVFAMLAQESFVFLAAPAFAYLLVALIRISFQPNPNHPETRFSLGYLATMLGIFLVIGVTFHGSAAQVARLWQHVNPLDRSLYPPGQYGDLEVIAFTVQDQLRNIVHLATSGFSWWYLSPLALLFLYCTAVACLVRGKASGWSLSYLSIAICAAPMFVLGVDYGRWVIMIQMTFLITLLSLGRERLASIRIFPLQMRSVKAKLDRFESFSDNLVNRHVPIVTVALLLFTLTFSMPITFIAISRVRTTPFEGPFPAAVVSTLRSIKHLR